MVGFVKFSEEMRSECEDSCTDYKHDRQIQAKSVKLYQELGVLNG
jgi:hypothetical protein